MNSSRVIAKYSAWKALPATVGPILGTLLIYVVPLIYKEGPLTILRSGRSYAPFVVIGWFVAPFYLFILLRIVVQVLFRKRVAIWQDGDSIFYLGSGLKSIDRRDIASIRASFLPIWGVRIPFICVVLRDGREHRIPIWALTDTAAIVMSRLEVITGAEAA